MDQKTRLAIVAGGLILTAGLMAATPDEFADEKARREAGVYSVSVEKPVEEVRDQMRYHLAASTWEKFPGTGAAPDDATVSLSDYDDGSLRLEMNGGGKRLVEVVTRFLPYDEGAGTRVDVVSDAAGLARAVPGLRPARLAEELQSDVEVGLLQMRAHGRARRGLSIVGVVNRAKRRRS